MQSNVLSGLETLMTSIERYVLYKVTCGVVKNGADVDFDVSSSGDSLAQQLDHVLALDAGAVEALGPLDKPRPRQTFLLAGEGKGEAQRQLLILYLPIGNEIRQTVGNVVKQFRPAAC